MTGRGAERRAASGGKISRRGFLKMGGAGLAGAALLGAGGCGGGGGSGEIVFSFNGSGEEGLEALISDFNRRHEGEIRVRWRRMPETSSEYLEQIQSEFQSGRSEVDVIAGDVIWLAQFAANGWVLDLSDRFTDDMKRDYLEGPLGSLEYEGATWGVPWFTDAGMFFYRRDLLEGAGYSGPPETWGEMKEQARKIMQDQGVEYGYVFQGSEDEGGVVDALEHVWNAGGDVLDGEEVVIDSSEAVAGLEVRRSMISDGIAPRASGDYTTQESQAIFTNGDAVFMRNWPFTYALLSDPEESSVGPGQVGVAALPVIERGNQSFSGLGGWNFMVNAQSEDRLDEIWTFVEYMTAAEQQKLWSTSGSYLPTRTSLYEDREVLNQVPVARLGGEALRNARPRPISPVYSDMSLQMAEQFNAAVKGEVPVDQALSELRDDLQNIAEQAPR